MKDGLTTGTVGGVVSGMLAVLFHLLEAMPFIMVNALCMSHDGHGLSKPVLTWCAFDLVISSSGLELVAEGAETVAAYSSADMDEVDMTWCCRGAWMPRIFLCNKRKKRKVRIWDGTAIFEEKEILQLMWLPTGDILFL